MNVKQELLQELQKVQNQVMQMQRALRAATPLAAGLSVMKEFEKLSRHVDRIKTEVSALQLGGSDEGR